MAIRAGFCFSILLGFLFAFAGRMPAPITLESSPTPKLKEPGKREKVITKESDRSSPVGRWEFSYSTGDTSSGNLLSGRKTQVFRSDGTGIITDVMNGYASPNIMYPTGLGIGYWTAVMKGRFTWVQIGRDRFAIKQAEPELSGETRYLTNVWRSAQDQCYIEGVFLHYTTGPKLTYTRVGD